VTLGRSVYYIYCCLIYLSSYDSPFSFIYTCPDGEVYGENLVWCDFVPGGVVAHITAKVKDNRCVSTSFEEGLSRMTNTRVSPCSDNNVDVFTYVLSVCSFSISFVENELNHPS
jgi:hypothetical protein